MNKTKEDMQIWQLVIFYSLTSFIRSLATQREREKISSQSCVWSHNSRHLMVLKKITIIYSTRKWWYAYQWWYTSHRLCIRCEFLVSYYIYICIQRKNENAKNVSVFLLLFFSLATENILRTLSKLSIKIIIIILQTSGNERQNSKRILQEN